MRATDEDVGLRHGNPLGDRAADGPGRRRIDEQHIQRNEHGPACAVGKVQGRGPERIVHARGNPRDVRVAEQRRGVRGADVNGESPGLKRHVAFLPRQLPPIGISVLSK